MNLQDSLTAAFQHHRAGNLAAAEQLYREILTHEPNHPETLHLLGVLAHQAGHLQPAVELISRAIELHPYAGHFHNNLGNALRAQGRFDEAHDAYEAALQLEPESVEAQSNLGNILRDQGRLDEAIAAYRQALALNPQDADVHSNLGNALREAGQLEEAVAVCRAGIAVDAKHAGAHHNLGNALRDLRRIAEAAAEYRTAIDLQPDFLDACIAWANMLVLLGRTTEAVAAYRWAIGTQPDSPDAHDGLGNALRETGDLTGAIAAARRAIELDPKPARFHLNLAVALSEQGADDEAFAACQLAPESPETRLALAHLHLLRGDYPKGLPLYEARWDAPEFQKLHTRLPQPRWDGRPLAGERVLIRAEQGFGDAIQFIRYAPLIVERGGVVIVECQPALVELFRTAPGVSEVVGIGSPLPPFDLQVPMLSLPLACGTTLETIPATIPYLSAGSRKRLGPKGSRLRVGLAWMGSPANPGNPLRSIPLKLLAPLLETPGVDFFSLQKGPGAEQMRDLPAGLRLIDHTAELHDFADTAALIAELDLVISIDSAVLHLAGALGRPAWGLLRFAADWRYLLRRPDSPWYPTLRLFRQPRYLDWKPVVEQVCDEDFVRT